MYKIFRIEANRWKNNGVKLPFQTRHERRWQSEDVHWINAGQTIATDGIPVAVDDEK